MENTSEVKGDGSAREAKPTKSAETEIDNAAVTITSTGTHAPKKGVVGEQSSLAKGSGPVLEIRNALAEERLHGLGWTREHLAFVLKVSVVGVRKLECEGTAPAGLTHEVRLQ